VALKKTMPTRDPERAKNEPQHSRNYSASTGGWTRPAQPEQPARGKNR
jgi:hypothetical protein